MFKQRCLGGGDGGRGGNGGMEEIVGKRRNAKGEL
jgi:hypothetical protein